MTKTNWNKTLWELAVSKLPKGLTIKAAAKRLNKPYPVTHMWLRHFKYKSPDSRGLWRKAKVGK